MATDLTNLQVSDSYNERINVVKFTIPDQKVRPGYFYLNLKQPDSVINSRDGITVTLKDKDYQDVASWSYVKDAERNFPHYAFSGQTFYLVLRGGI